jgi:uncharacterized protein (TIGR03435 family)
MQFFDRPLINATGLKGRYDIRLDLTSVMAAVSAMMTEMQEQLGLKIEPMDVLVVDQAEKAPAEN